MIDIYKKWQGCVISVVLKEPEREMIGYISTYEESPHIILSPLKTSYKEDPKIMEKFGEFSMIKYPTYIPRNEIRVVLLLDENYEED